MKSNNGLESCHRIPRLQKQSVIKCININQTLFLFESQDYCTHNPQQLVKLRSGNLVSSIQITMMPIEGRAILIPC